jgi:hypothetical protein
VDVEILEPEVLYDVALAGYVEVLPTPANLVAGTAGGKREPLPEQPDRLHALVLDPDQLPLTAGSPLKPDA